MRETIQPLDANPYRIARGQVFFQRIVPCEELRERLPEAVAAAGSQAAFARQLGYRDGGAQVSRMLRGRRPITGAVRLGLLRRGESGFLDLGDLGDTTLTLEARRP